MSAIAIVLALIAILISLSARKEVMDNTEKVEAITAEFQSYKADVSARVADLGAKIDALQQGVADGAETAALDKLLADVKSAHSELSDATNPAPEPEPITT